MHVISIRRYYSPFADEETGAKRSELPCSRLHTVEEQAGPWPHTVGSWAASQELGMNQTTAAWTREHTLGGTSQPGFPGPQQHSVEVEPQNSQN